MHDGEAYGMEDDQPVDGDEEGDNDGNEGNEIEEDGDGGVDIIAPSINDQSSGVAASTDVVTFRKRKADEQHGNAAKKAKCSNDSTIVGGVIARSIAGMKRKRSTSTVDAALSKQEVGDADVGNMEANGDNV